MKPLFRCDYCNFTGTEEEVKEHEAQCLENYNLKSCLTCNYRDTNSKWDQVSCACGVDVPEGKYIKMCGKYERKDSDQSKETGPFTDLFNCLFGKR